MTDAIIAVICGSTKNRKQMTELNKKLTLEGKIVLAPGVFAHDGDEITDEQKTKLDALHLEKIDLADEVHVVVVVPGGYIGLSTSAEIEYAKKTGKPITFHHDISLGQTPSLETLARTLHLDDYPGKPDLWDDENAILQAEYLRKAAAVMKLYGEAES